MATATTGQQAIEHEIEAHLQRELPDVDLREVQVIGRDGDGTLRVVVDHPAGVDHGLCATVTKVLDRAGVLDRFGVEVWSPGPEPPLRTLDHYRAAIGEVIVMKVSEDGRTRARSVSGTLVSVEADRVEVSTPDGVREIAFEAIQRGRVSERSEA